MLFFSLSAWALPDNEIIARALSEPPLPVPAEYQAEIARVQERGATLSAMDARSWLATDRVFEIVGVPTPKSPPPFEGWVTRPKEAGFQVDFLRDPRKPKVVCTVVFDGPESQGQATCPKRPLRAEDPELVASFRARQAAIHDPGFVPKVPSYNFEVLSPSEDGSFEVFLLPAMTDFAIIPVLGGYRARVDASGTVLSMDPLSYDPMSIPAAPEGQPTIGVMSHLLSPTPNEGHTFASARYGITLLVVTEAGMWRIEDGVPSWMGAPPEQ